MDLNQKENAYKKIKEMIVDGDLQMGKNVSDRLLSKKLKLGLTPVRDALNLLKSEDLVISFPKKGTFVFELSSKLFFDIFESRRIFETYGLKTSNKLNYISSTGDTVLQLSLVSSCFNGIFSNRVRLKICKIV